MSWGVKYQRRAEGKWSFGMFSWQEEKSAVTFTSYDGMPWASYQSSQFSVLVVEDVVTETKLKSNDIVHFEINCGGHQSRYGPRKDVRLEGGSLRRLAWAWGGLRLFGCCAGLLRCLHLRFRPCLAKVLHITNIALHQRKPLSLIKMTQRRLILQKRRVRVTPWSRLALRVRTGGHPGRMPMWRYSAPAQMTRIGRSMLYYQQQEMSRFVLMLLFNCTTIVSRFSYKSIVYA